MMILIGILLMKKDKEEFLKWVADIYNLQEYEKDFNKFAINSYANVKIIDCVIE